MNVRQAAFDLCKALACIPAQTELAKAVRSIANTRFHYTGHGRHAQTFGFLVTDQERAEFEQPPISIKLEPLDESVREVFAAYHKEILNLNKRCIQRLTDARPNCTSDVLSPYNRFAPVSLGKTITTGFFPLAETDALIEAFQNHPLIQIAIDGSDIVGPTFSPAHYIHAILKLEEEIKHYGPLVTPTDIKQTLERSAPNSRKWLEMQHISAVAGLRASLGTLNQLLYTKVFLKNLPCLDKDNIVSFGSYHFATGGTKLVYQEGGLMFVVETDDIIVVKDVPPREEVTNFCRIERLSPFIPPMPGETRYIELLEIDENLNPYSTLFSAFYKPARIYLAEDTK